MVIKASSLRVLRTPPVGHDALLVGILCPHLLDTMHPCLPRLPGVPLRMRRRSQPPTVFVIDNRHAGERFTQGNCYVELVSVWTALDLLAGDHPVLQEAQTPRAAVDRDNGELRTQANPKGRVSRPAERRTRTSTVYRSRGSDGASSLKMLFGEGRLQGAARGTTRSPAGGGESNVVQTTSTPTGPGGRSPPQ